MRVALVSFGFGEYCVRLANLLVEHTQCQLMLLADRRRVGIFADQIRDSVEVELFDSPRLRQPFRHFVNARHLLRTVRSFDPDVVHFQGAHLWFNWFLPSVKRRFPLVVTAHDVRLHLGDRDSRKTPQSVLDFGYRQADRLIVHGEKLRQQLEDYLNISAENVSITPMVPQGPVEATGIGDQKAPEPHTILFFGRIWPYKGLDILIQAMPFVQASIPGVRVVIAGEGEDLDRYQRMMHDKSVYEIHNEYISDTFRNRLFRRASVVVLPYVEGTQSGVIPVAHALARPVIVSDVGAIAEAVEHGETGLIVPPADPQALAQSIVTMLKDPDRSQRMGLAGRERLNDQRRRVAVLHYDAYQLALRSRQCPRELSRSQETH